ncbi:MAG: hypothetical protein NO515_06785 [Candidatus Methanomethylicia archaeon]|nr:hypothetical protein [Candidatus Methanomethylicia archaeon]
MKSKVIAILLVMLFAGATFGYTASAYFVYQPQIDKLNSDLLATQNRLSELQIEKAALEANYASLSKDYDQLNLTYSNLKTNYETLSINYSQLNLEYNQLKNGYSLLLANYSQLSARYDDLNSKYTALNAAYIQLQSSQGTLSTQYSTLQTSYNILSQSYNQLQAAYTQLQIDYDKESSLRIGTTLETYYDYVRANLLTLGFFPLGEERWYLFPDYYNSSVTFAASMAAHDAGNAYWSSMEEGSRYYEITGEHSYDTANNIMTKAMIYAGIKATDSYVDKIDKILNFVNSRVIYQSRLLDHMWFPTETLTFKSGDCTSFSILAACMFEKAGIKSAIGFFKHENESHAMVLVRLDNLGSYSYSYYPSLTSYGLSAGKWIVIEPQFKSLSKYSSNLDWVMQWGLVAACEVPYGA